MKKFFKILGRILLLLIVIVFINFIPVFTNSHDGMSVKENPYFTFYYQKEETAAQDVYQFADKEVPNIIKKLQITHPEKLQITLLDSQKDLQARSYGYIMYLFDLPWFIGGADGNEILMLNPANKESSHNYNMIKRTILHEMVHSYSFQINPDSRDLWLLEGLAVYLAKQTPDLKPSDMIGTKLPTFEESQTKNSITFSNMGGYKFAPLYVSFLNDQYGFDKVLSLLKTDDYKATFGKDREAIYQEWTNYMKSQGIN